MKNHTQPHSDFIRRSMEPVEIDQTDINRLQAYAESVFEYMPIIPVHAGYKRTALMQEHQRVNRLIKRFNQSC